MRKSDLSDEIKRSFFQVAFVSILLYGCITWTLTTRMEKKLDGNYTRMLEAVLNKSWRRHPTKQHPYGRQPMITKTIQIRRVRYAGHCWRSKGDLTSDVFLWPVHKDEQVLGDKLEIIYHSALTQVIQSTRTVAHTDCTTVEG